MKGNGMMNNMMEVTTQQKLSLPDTMNQLGTMGLLKVGEQPGTIFVIVMFFII